MSQTEIRAALASGRDSGFCYFAFARRFFVANSVAGAAGVIWSAWRGEIKTIVGRHQSQELLHFPAFCLSLRCGQSLITPTEPESASCIGSRLKQAAESLRMCPTYRRDFLLTNDWWFPHMTFADRKRRTSLDVRVCSLGRVQADRLARRNSSRSFRSKRPCTRRFTQPVPQLHPCAARKGSVVSKARTADSGTS